MLAVIPARSTSKGIPRKNLMHCGGMTLLARVLEFTRHVTDYVIVTTDGDEETHRVALGYGAFVADAYPPQFHGDNSRAPDVWKDAWLKAEAHWKREFEWSVYLEPTCPLRTLDMVEAAVRAIHEPSIDAAWSVEPVPVKYHGAKQLAAQDGLLGYADPVGSVSPPRQQLSLRYVRNGAVYVVRRRALVLEGSILPARRTRAIVTDPLVNIDTIEDLLEADRRLQACR